MIATQATTGQVRPRRAPRPERGWRDLTFVGVSGAAGEVITYGAPSASTPGKTNLVSLDLQTGEVHCTCKHCETHPGDAPSCWLARSVAAAWGRHPARLEVAGMPDATLLAYGSKLAAHVRIYTARCGRPLPMDLCNLLAARDEWRARARARVDARRDGAGEGD